MSLRADNLVFGIAGRRIGSLSLELHAGQSMCVLGPNGAGKTTLFRTLLGLLPPLAGSVSMAGRELSAMSRSDVARSIAYVPQAMPLAFDFPLIEMVEMGRVAHLGAFTRPSRADTAKARNALEQLGLGAMALRRCSEVSGGERQLALIARALVTGAPFLVLDEPAAHLDYGNQRRLLDEVARLRDGGVGVLFCSHDPAHALRVADRVLLLERGTVLAQGAAAEVLTPENLGRLYGVPVMLGAA